MSYTITLVGCKGDEIELIAMCMELCGLDMNSASAVVDHMPSILFENIDEDSANKYKKMLEGVGAILKIDESAVSAPDPFDPFPEPDFGKVLSGIAPQMAQPTVQPAPEHVAQPESVAVQPYSSQIQSQPEHIALQPEPEQEQEPVKQPQSVIEITPRNKDIVENNHHEETHNTSSSDSKGNSDSSEDTKYEYYGYCPRCGSSFVTVKKVGGLFGSNKVKCVCEACKYKF